MNSDGVDHLHVRRGTPPTVTEVASAVVKPAPKIVTLVDPAPVAPDGSAIFGVMLMTASARDGVGECAVCGSGSRIGIGHRTLTESCAWPDRAACGR